VIGTGAGTRENKKSRRQPVTGAIHCSQLRSTLLCARVPIGFYSKPIAVLCHVGPVLFSTRVFTNPKSIATIPAVTQCGVGGRQYPGRRHVGGPARPDRPDPGKTLLHRPSRSNQGIGISRPSPRELIGMNEVSQQFHAVDEARAGPPPSPASVESNDLRSRWDLPILGTTRDVSRASW
jgi:hypothetical protein